MNISYILHIVVICEIYCILALATNLSSGYTGLLSFCNAVFYSVGAYTTTILMKNIGLSFFPALGIAILLNIGVSLPLSYLATRLKHLQFTLSTIAFQVIFYSIIYNWEGLTNGSYGISEIPYPKVFGFVCEDAASFSVLGGILLLLVIVFFHFFQKTPFVRILESLRDNELGIISLGKNVSYYKYVTIALAAAMMSISGAMFATYSSYIDPTSFSLDESIFIISMILISGTGNVKAPIFGALFYVLLPEIIKLVPISGTQGASLRIMVSSLILILIVRYKPNGIFGKYGFN